MIDWKAAPPWARYATRDADGEVVVWSYQPKTGDRYPYWMMDYSFVPGQRLSKLVGKGAPDAEWRNSIEERQTW